MIVLLLAGIALLLAGFVAIAFGVPVKEFSFGNTLIMSGVIAAGTGAILLGLSAVLRELKSITDVLAAGVPIPAARMPTQPRLAALEADDKVEPAAGNDGFPFPRDHSAAEPSIDVQPSLPTSPGAESTLAPWQEEARDRARQRGVAPPADQAPEPVAKPRRNLLFSSSSRKERERADKAQAAIDGAPATAAAAEPPPRTFEEAWPETERGRSDLATRRSRPAPAAAVATDAVAVPEPAPAENAAQVTVLKSGVVDGMAYSLYSDGSIEAQMPEGMMRFASIDELRSHLDQRP
ncbi:MAG: hypothetical protein HXX15_13340 [Rhodopseudomonas sp.]|nr:hypothetical protein [Rhodopseudomonas sp.]NVN87059.1 hypothetical protein [Rhodopseudomonas sp.]